MKIEQQVGGTKPEQDAYTGEARQLTVDTDNWDLRLHDGVTPGGRLIINRDNGDERWQAKSSELDGFDFNPEQRGYIVRVGPGEYRVRRLTVNESNLQITYPDAYNGNTYLEIPTNILSDHIFGGDIIINGVLQVDGGINADISGDITGNVTGNLTGNVVGNLTGNASGNHTGSFTGDVDVRGSDFLLDDGQIATSKIAGLEAYVKLHAVPVGVILMWSGLEVDVPAGWYLCNGLNGTPDLRSRFIVGAGAGGLYDPADSGGAATHSHDNTIDNSGAHSHTVTVDGHSLTEAELPSHKHLLAKFGVASDTLTGANQLSQETSAGGDTEYRLKGTGSAADVGLSGATGSGTAHSHTASTASGGTHTHTINNATEDNLPPYYALCFIMRGA